MNGNNLQQVKQQPKFSVAIQSDGYKKLINDTLGDKKRALNFVANISTAVSQNPTLQECTPASIVSAGLMAETLGLSMSTTLGHVYLVPFNNKKLNCKQAQFQLGYKGYLQLAMRSGQYKKINVLVIKEGELISYDPLTEDLEVNIDFTDEKREEKATIGYYAMFEYLNGFKKSIYWSKARMVAHAKKYSQAYAKDLEKGWSMSFWTTNFDEMAIKTMLRQLISKWGVMSIEMQAAYKSDMAILEKGKEPEYVDSTTYNTETKITEEIETDANTGEVLEIKEEKAPVVKEEVKAATTEEDNPY